MNDQICAAGAPDFEHPVSEWSNVSAETLNLNPKGVTGQIVSSNLPVSTFAQGIRNSEPDLGSKQRGGSLPKGGVTPLGMS